MRLELHCSNKTEDSIQLKKMSSGSGRFSRNRNDRNPDIGLFRVTKPSRIRINDIDLSLKPEVVGYFSVDSDRSYVPNSSNLSYYNPPKENKVSFDLNEGLEKVKRKPLSANDEKLDHLLKWIKLQYMTNPTLIEDERWFQPNFVCFRGLLTLLMCTPYSPADTWIICAAKWKGVIYLCRFKTLEEKRHEANLSMDASKFMSWGFKFEKYILTDTPEASPNATKAVDESEEFCCMFKRQIGCHTILFGAEMDGVLTKTKLEDPLPLKDLRFVELKTSKIIEHVGQERNFRKFKLLKWWAQSYLVGIKEILCGFRDDEGIVRNLTSYSLPAIVQKAEDFWDPKACVAFCEDFLTHVSKTVVNSCDETVYKFERYPYGDIVMSEMSPTSEYAFMEGSYLEEMEREMLRRDRCDNKQ